MCVCGVHVPSCRFLLPSLHSIIKPSCQQPETLLFFYVSACTQSWVVHYIIMPSVRSLSTVFEGCLCEWIPSLRMIRQHQSTDAPPFCSCVRVYAGVLCCLPAVSRELPRGRPGRTRSSAPRAQTGPAGSGSDCSSKSDRQQNILGCYTTFIHNTNT